jgi:hypothetical protein
LAKGSGGAPHRRLEIDCNLSFKGLQRRRELASSIHTHLLLPLPPRLAREGGWKRSGRQVAAPEICSHAWSERQELSHPFPSPSRPARGDSGALAALTDADPPVHLHLPSPSRPARGKDIAERGHTYRKTTMVDLLKEWWHSLPPPAPVIGDRRGQGVTLDPRSRRPNLEFQHPRA